MRRTSILQTTLNQQKPNETLNNTKSLTKIYSYWRFRIMYTMMIGYAAFYLVRQNFTVCIPYFQSELGFSKLEIGWIISIGSIVYGLGKGISGFISDRTNARYFMSIGLFFSALISFLIGFFQGYVSLLILWVLNNCFQSMGWPPCARLLTHWYSSKELATRWAVWNMSQQIGGALVLLISGGFLINHFGWPSVFFVPAIICMVMSVFLFNRLRDTPSSLGLPPIEVYHGLTTHNPDYKEEKITLKELYSQVLSNKLVWYMCFANFFVYVVRMSIFNWAPTFLQEFKNGSIAIAATQTAMFDLTGMFGGVIAGYLSDKVFKGYRGRVGVFYMMGLIAGIIILWKSPSNSTFLHFFGMMLIGFLVTGPQILIGVAATDFSSKKAAGAASGLTGTVGYIGTAVTGAGMGYVVDSYGWDLAFLFITISGFLSMICFILTWNHRSKALDNKENKN